MNEGITKASPMSGTTKTSTVMTTVHQMYLRVFSAETYIASTFFSRVSSRCASSVSIMRTILAWAPCGLHLLFIRRMYPVGDHLLESNHLRTMSSTEKTLLWVGAAVIVVGGAWWLIAGKSPAPSAYAPTTSTTPSGQNSG